MTNKALCVLLTLSLASAIVGCATATVSEDMGPDAGTEKGDLTNNTPEAPDAGPPPDTSPESLPCLDGAQNMIDTTTGNCLMYFTSKLAWAAASQACASLDGNTTLAGISSATENELQRSMINTAEAWVGGSDQASEGSFTWEDGSMWSFSNWRDGEPNNAGNEDCVVLQGHKGGKWDDRPCGHSYGYLCERTP